MKKKNAESIVMDSTQEQRRAAMERAQHLASLYKTDKTKNAELHRLIAAIVTNSVMGGPTKLWP